MGRIKSGHSYLCNNGNFIVFLFSSYIKYVPKFIVFISNYSYCIYLIHYFFVHDLGLLSRNPIKMYYSIPSLHLL